MNKFRVQLNTLLLRSGKKKGWLADKMQMHRQSFWRKVNKDGFTEQEKKLIKSFLK